MAAPGAFRQAEHHQPGAARPIFGPVGVHQVEQGVDFLCVGHTESARLFSDSR